MQVELQENFPGQAFAVRYYQDIDATVAVAQSAAVTVTHWAEGPSVELDICGESFHGSSLRFALQSAVFEASVTYDRPRPLHAMLKVLGVHFERAVDEVNE